MEQAANTPQRWYEQETHVWTDRYKLRYYLVSPASTPRSIYVQHKRSENAMRRSKAICAMLPLVELHFFEVCRA